MFDVDYRDIEKAFEGDPADRTVPGDDSNELLFAIPQ